MKTKSILMTLAATVCLCGFLASHGLAQYDPRPPAGNSGGKNAKEPSGSKVVGLRGIEKATPITKEEAAQKYPPPRSGYPTAEITQGPEAGASNTVVESPYPPHLRYDVSDIPRGGLVLDPRSKHVFIRP